MSLSIHKCQRSYGVGCSVVLGNVWYHHWVWDLILQELLAKSWSGASYRVFHARIWKATIRRKLLSIMRVPIHLVVHCILTYVWFLLGARLCGLMLLWACFGLLEYVQNWPLRLLSVDIELLHWRQLRVRFLKKWCLGVRSVWLQKIWVEPWRLLSEE